MTEGETNNIFRGNPDSGSGGSGILGGILGGVLGGVLFDRRGAGAAVVEPCAVTGQGETRLNDTIFNASVMAKLGSIEAAIPFNEAQVQLALGVTQNAIMGQATTNATAATAQATENANTLAAQATMNFNASTLATSGVKDAVQNSALLAQQNTAAILNAIANSTCTIVSKIDGNTIAELQAQLSETRSRGHARETEVHVTQTVNQNQAQAQQQAQIQGMFGALQNLANDLQTIKQGQVIFNSGVMAASGTQAAANTRVA